MTFQARPARDCIPEAKRHANRLGDSSTAFVMGGIGKYGTFPGLNKCVALAETLFRIGGYVGNVYIMTDTLPNATDMKRVRQGNPNLRFVEIPPERDGVDFRLHSGGGGGGYLKTMIFDLPAIKEDILIWHDCDKMIGQTGCIADMWHDAPLEFGPHSQILLGSAPRDDRGQPLCRKGWGDYADRCGDGIHVGVFAAHRKISRGIMNEWKENQQREPATYDRYTFYDAWKKLNTTVISLPQAWSDHMYNKKDGVQCVNHMSGPRVWDKENRGFLEPFLQSMCLKGVSYDDAYFVYANILKFTKYPNGTETVVIEQRYWP
jgi:hypothetical protein